MSEETTQNTPLPDTSNPTVSEQVTLPPEAPEAPRDAVTPPPVKDDNLSQNVPEDQVAEPVQTAQMATEPEQTQAPETVPETGTAQSVGNEPLKKSVEPIAPEPTPVSALVSVAPQPKNIIRELFAKAQQAIQFRKRKKLDRVMTLFAKRTNITNNQVGELIHVSNATATRGKWGQPPFMIYLYYV